MMIIRLTQFSAAVLLLSLITSGGIIGGRSLVSADLIDEICADTQIRTFCLKFFKSDHSSSATPVKLCIKAIDRGRPRAKKTKKLVDSLVNRTTDPWLKSVYITCAETYDMAISNLEEARESLKDLPTLNTELSATMTDVDTCEDGFGGEPIKPGKLRDGNRFLMNVCSIALAITQRMKI